MKHFFRAKKVNIIIVSSYTQSSNITIGKNLVHTHTFYRAKMFV